MARKTLSPREDRFVTQYLIDLNGAQAAIRSGYSRNGADVQACRLLGTARVAAAVAAGKARQLAKAELSAARVLEELRRLAMFDPGLLHGEDGEILPLHQMPAEARVALTGIEWVMKNATAGDGKVDRVLKIRFAQKVQALELLAKHFKLLTEVHEISGATEELLARLDRGRERNAKRQK